MNLQVTETTATEIEQLQHPDLGMGKEVDGVALTRTRNVTAAWGIFQNMKANRDFPGIVRLAQAHDRFVRKKDFESEKLFEFRLAAVDALTALGRLDDALKWLAWIEQTYNASFRTQAVKAAIALRAGDLSLAREVAAAAFEVEPGRAFGEPKKCAEAEIILQSAKECACDIPELYDMLALAFREQRKTTLESEAMAAAVAAKRKVQAIPSYDPDGEHPNFGLGKDVDGVAQSGRRDVTAAWEIFERMRAEGDSIGILKLVQVHDRFVRDKDYKSEKLFEFRIAGVNALDTIGRADDALGWLDWLERRYGSGFRIHATRAILAAHRNDTAALQEASRAANATTTEGKAFVLTKKHISAESEFHKATEHGCEVAEYYYMLALIFHDQGKHEHEYEALKKAASLNQSELSWNLRLAELCVAEQKWAEAEEAFRNAIEQDNSVTDYYYQLANMLRKQGKSWQEGDALESALALNSDNAHWHFRLGEIREEMSQFDQAAESYAAAVTLNETDANWHFRLGYALEQAGKLFQARAAYANAINKDTTKLSQRYGVGVFHQNCGNWLQAATAYNAQIERDPLHAELFYRLGLSYDWGNELGNAEQAYVAAISLDRSKIEWHYRLGVVRERMGLWDRAAQAYRYAAVHSERHTPYWYYRLGYVLTRDGRYQEGCRAFLETRTQKTLDPELPEDGQEIDKGQKYSGRKVGLPDLNTAYLQGFSVIKLIHRALERDTTNSDLYYLLGNEYERCAEWEKAAWAYREAIMRKDEHNTHWYFRLGSALLEAKRWEESAMAFAEMDFLVNFRKRIGRECIVDIVSLSFKDGNYIFSANIQNRSKINSEIFVNKFVLKHRERIGNEVDEYDLVSKVIIDRPKDTLLRFEFDGRGSEMALHYWDLYVDLLVMDKTYGTVKVRVPVKNLSTNLLHEIDDDPWAFATEDDENVLYPYVTSRGKLAFIKRPKAEYDQKIYQDRERQALSEYLQNKVELDDRKAWMIYEKYSKTAQDNGLYFFKKAVQQRPHVYFVIEQDSPDRVHLEGFESNVVDFMSVEHMKLLLSCEMLISSDSRGHGYAWRRVFGKFKQALLGKKYVFLQHGVTALKTNSNVFAKNNKFFAADKFIVTCEMEKKIVMDAWGYEENDMILSGFPRWDEFYDVSINRNEIFLMPTWRNWLEDMSDEDFIKTDYFNSYLGLLTSDSLHKLLQKHDVVLNFYLHPKIIAHLNKFEVNSARVKVVDFGERSIRDLLQSARLLITDYSSVAWDFVYLGKPVLFYQFDLDRYEEYQGAYIDLKKDLPGRAAYNEKDLFSLLSDALGNPQEYCERAKSLKSTYFSALNGTSCETIYRQLEM